MPRTAPARNAYLIRTYGIGIEQYDALVAAHDGKCWICDRPPTGRRLHVEHNHRTKEIRGVVGWQCNAGLRAFKDDPKLLRAAADYLESSEAQDILRFFVPPVLTSIQEPTDHGEQVQEATYIGD